MHMACALCNPFDQQPEWQKCSRKANDLNWRTKLDTRALNGNVNRLECTWVSFASKYCMKSNTTGSYISQISKDSWKLVWTFAMDAIQETSPLANVAGLLSCFCSFVFQTKPLLTWIAVATSFLVSRGNHGFGKQPCLALLPSSPFPTLTLSHNSYTSKWTTFNVACFHRTL